MMEFVILILALALVSQSVVGYFVIKLLINRPEPNDDRSDTRPIKVEFDQKIEVPEIMPSLKKPPRPPGGFGSNVG